MTNKERLISLIGFAPAENAAEGALMDLGVLSTDPYVITGDASVDTVVINKIKLAAIQVMRALITTADTSNLTTGFAIKYDRAAILKLIAQFEDDLGITVGPTIKNVSFAW